MHTEEEKKHLLNALDTLQGELVLISPEFYILAANKYAKEIQGDNLVGQLCYQKYFKFSSPCSNCPINDDLNSKQMIKWQQNLEDVNLEDRIICYPVSAQGELKFLVMLDCDLSKMGRLEKKLQRSNAFLHNLLNSSVDAVIAADKEGNILIFNQAAHDILDYSKEEALNQLNIRDLYPPGGAKKIMQKLRSKECGGEGKLKAYQVDRKSVV